MPARSARSVLVPTIAELKRNRHRGGFKPATDFSRRRGRQASDEDMPDAEYDTILQHMKLIEKHEEEAVQKISGNKRDIQEIKETVQRKRTRGRQRPPAVVREQSAPAKAAEDDDSRSEDNSWSSDMYDEAFNEAVKRGQSAPTEAAEDDDSRSWSSSVYDEAFNEAAERERQGNDNFREPEDGDAQEGPADAGETEGIREEVADAVEEIRDESGDRGRRVVNMACSACSHQVRESLNDILVDTLMDSVDMQVLMVGIFGEAVAHMQGTTEERAHALADFLSCIDQWQRSVDAAP